MPPALVWRVLAPFLLLSACAMVFWQGLGGGFILDDFNNIVLNKAIQLEQLDAESLHKALSGYPVAGTGRPLATMSLAMNYWAGGTNPYGYKLTNLAIHAVNALLVLILLYRLLGASALSPRAIFWTSLLVAIAWAVHPLQVSTVLYSVQRMEILATTFVLLALLAYLKGRFAQMRGEPGMHYIGVSLAFTAVGMLAKESAVLFPAFALSLELTVLRFKANDARVSQRLITGYLIAFAIALIFFFLFLPTALAPESYAMRDFSVGERLLSQLRVLPMYLGQILMPLPGSLTFYYDTFEASRSLLQPWTTAAGMAILFSLASLAWLLRSRAPFISLGILWFFSGHALTSNVINLELVFEHRNYFPLLGVLLAAAISFQLLTRKLSPQFSVLFGLVLVIGIAGLAAIRSATWGDELLLATDLSARNPDSPRASSELATLYAGMSDGNPESPFYAFAISEFERGSLLPGASPLPEQGLILLSASTGQPVKNEWWDRIIHKLQTQAVGPQEIMAISGLMNQRYDGIELDDRRLAEAYGTMLDRRPMEPQFYAQLGDFALRYLRDEELADRMFIKLAHASASDIEYVLNVAGALAADGHQRQADLLFSIAADTGGNAAENQEAHE